jgi:tetratricopeptide (TPR) repeat protein
MFRRLIILGVLLLAVLAGLWFARRPIIDGVKEWRANSLISRAEDEKAEGNGREANLSATAAWQLGPKKIETLRRLVTFGRQSGFPDLAAVTLLVFFHEDHSPADREEILKWSLDRGDPAFFDQLYPNLDEASRAVPSVRLLHARKLAMQGRLLESVEEARMIEASGVLPTEVSLLLAEILPRLPDNPVAAGQARDRIHALLGNGDESVALRAWRLLSLLPPGLRDPGASFDPVTWVASKPGAVPSDRVAARRLLVDRLPEAERPEAIRKLSLELLGDSEAVPYLVRWLLESGNGELLLELPESVFLSEVTVFSARLQVLLERNRLDEAKAWLARAPEDFPVTVAGSLEAVFLRREGRASESLSAWRRVLDRAVNLQVYGELLSILQIAERFGDEAAAQSAVDAIVALPPNQLPASERLEFLEPRFVAKPGAWLEFWRGMLRFRPGDAFAAEQVSFMELGETEGVDAAAALDRTEKALKRFPAVPRFRATYALWLLREQRNDEALKLLRESSLNWNEAEPMVRVAYALALFRSGARAEAQALVAVLPWDRVLPLRRARLISLMTEWTQNSAS